MADSEYNRAPLIPDEQVSVLADPRAYASDEIYHT